MHEGTTEVVQLPVGSGRDVLTGILREGAEKLLIQAIEAEVAAYIEQHADRRDADGHRLVVRNGHMPVRKIQTGVGPVTVRQPRVNDQRVDEAGQRIRFASEILPPYLRKTRSIEELVPWLYLKGISTGDFSEALAALLGPEAPGLSASTVVRLKDVWQREHEVWSKRSLAGKRYVYFWADGIYFNIRLEEDRQCILVVMGATPEGKK
jgi:putative transposase